MIRFNNDYNHGAFASILKELGATNSTSYAGYGEDEWCDKAETIIKKLVDNDDALIKFIPGATQIPDISIVTRRRPSRTPDTRFWNFRIQMARLPRSRSPLAPRRITIRTSRSI